MLPREHRSLNYGFSLERVLITFPSCMCFTHQVEIEQPPALPFQLFLRFLFNDAANSSDYVRVAYYSD